HTIVTLFPYTTLFRSPYLRARLQEARWFLKSLRSRNATLLTVAERIVAVQKGFFSHGEEAMKPLVLADIAETVGMHESTISRVTDRKSTRLNSSHVSI